MIVDLEAIFEMESQLEVVSIEPARRDEPKKEMEVSVQETNKSWETPPPEINRIPA